MKLRLFSLLFASLLMSCSLGGFKTSRTEKVSRYPSGKLKNIEYVRTNRFNSNDILSFYQTIRSLSYEFDEDSVLIMQTERKTRQGEGGNGCFVVMERSREFYANGKVKKETLVRCDGKKTITRYYTKEGKLNFTRTERRILR